jgi:lincosamide nucleotidyltransferase A/C/D/E
MDEAAVIEVIRRLEDHGVRCWVLGGWGVDALEGLATREHKDLDVFLALSEHARAWRLLHEDGFRLAYRWEENVDLPGDLTGDVQPTAYVLQHDDGRELDVHVLGDDTDPMTVLWGHRLELVPGALDGVGTIGGATVSCLSAEMQVAAHQGYEVPEAQRNDLARVQRLLAAESGGSAT